MMITSFSTGIPWYKNGNRVQLILFNKHMSYVAWIFQFVLDRSSSQQTITATHSPQHPLEVRQSLTMDHTGHKTNEPLTII